jgi:hypothetical protein
MEKWADYGISKVQYDSEHTHIVKVQVHEDKGDKIGTGSEWSRTQVVSGIEGEKSFVTILKKADSYVQGQRVGIVTVNKVKYIRTDENQTASDNLEKLPEF